MPQRSKFTQNFRKQKEIFLWQEEKNSKTLPSHQSNDFFSIQKSDWINPLHRIYGADVSFISELSFLLALEDFFFGLRFSLNFFYISP